MEERIGEAFELGEPLTVVGRKLAAGDPAPEGDWIEIPASLVHLQRTPSGMRATADAPALADHLLTRKAC